MPNLAVNIDHIATLREARKGNTPDPVPAAALAELAGADGIVVHLREDRRHIKERDVDLLRKTVKTRLILEMAPTQEMLKIVFSIKPDMVTLVPERREELTTESGLDIILALDSLKKYVRTLKDGNITVSIFVNPDLDQIKAAHKIGTDYIEIHTGLYAEARKSDESKFEFEKILNAAKFASKLGLGINAGHGLDYNNVQTIAQIGEIEELSIGHSIMSRAMYTGILQAVKEMKQLIFEALMLSEG
ncbi:MAG TPA: pyridoxine 5'-phosphate synthase [bacterium]